MSSQDMVTEGNAWNIALFKGVSSPINTTYYVRIKGDTTIEETKYKVLEYKIPNTEIWEPSIDYVRQDGQKVYFKRGEIEETLIYDFGLEKGDEFQMYNDCAYTVADVDSVYTAQGDRRKRLKLVRQGFIPGEQFWIEGVGSNLGVFTHQNYCYFDYAEEFLCFYQQDQLCFPENPETCEFGSVSTKTPTHKNLSIYPIPATDYIKVSLTRTMPTNYTIWDTTGRLCSEGELDINQNTIEVSVLKSGSYFIRLRSDKNVYQTRFVKQ